MINRQKLCTALVFLTIFCFQGCSAIRESNMRRQSELDDRIYYGIFLPSAVSEYCARDIAFTGDSHDGMCQEYRHRPEIKEKISRLKKQVEGLTEEEIKQSTSGNISLGMSYSAVRLSLGTPDKINDTTTQNGTHSQWVYTDLMYVYFEEGKVTAWQQSY